MAGTRRALLALYRWYRANEPLLAKVVADADRLAPLREAMQPFEAYLDELTRAIERLWPGWSRRRRATLRHAADFTTWRSLSRLTTGDRAAVAIVLEWLE